MLDRRSLFKLLPAAVVPLPALADEHAEATKAEVTPDKPLIVFRLTTALSGERMEQFCKNAREGLDRSGFAGVAAIVIPHGVEFDVYSLPGVGPCLESEHLKCASSAGSR